METMVVVLTEDFLVPAGWQYQLADAIPGVELVEVEGARHELVWTHADRVADELRRFLA